MGSGSMIAAARANGLRAVGIEALPEHHAMARQALPLLSELTSKGQCRIKVG